MAVEAGWQRREPFLQLGRAAIQSLRGCAWEIRPDDGQLCALTLTQAD
jgi:hypothetical protein